MDNELFELLQEFATTRVPDLAFLTSAQELKRGINNCRVN
jgi:hypothetical protein